ncbi:unnamed protein product [Prunus armeniaca]
MTPAFDNRKREAKQSVGKESSTGKPRRFILKVVPSGPPRTNEATPPERSQPSKPVVSESPSHTGKVLETSPLRWKMGTTPKRKRSDTPPVSPQVTPKCHSMRILHARFTGTRTSNVEASGTPTVVTIDNDSNDGDTTESEANVPEQENVHDIGDIREDSDRDYNDDCNEDAFAYSSDYPGGQGGSDAFLGSVGSSTCHFSAEPVTDIAEGSSLAVAIADPARSPPEDLARAVFGARAVHNMKSNPSPDEIRAAAEALVFKQRELENQRRELRGLLSAQGVSPDSADCVIEAVTRSSHRASSVLF